METGVRDEFEANWRRFAKDPRTKPSAAGRHSQPRSPSDYLIYLIALDEELEVRTAVRRLQSCLALPFVDPVPPEALHVTVQGIGYDDQLSPELLAELVERARPVFSSLAPFEVRVQRANSFDVAAFYEVDDGGAIREARARLREAMPWLVEMGRDPLVRDGRDTFLPHVSVAYYNSESDGQGVVSVLRAHRDDLVATVRVTSVQLVAVRLPLLPGRLSYRVKATFALGGSSTRRPSSAET